MRRAPLYAHSDIDLLVQPPAGADLVSYRGLDPRRDRDILRDTVLL